MTLAQAIKRYNLRRVAHDFDGTPLPRGYVLYMSDKETDEAIYHYTADRDEDFCPHGFLTVITYYKSRNAETARTYVLED